MNNEVDTIKCETLHGGQILAKALKQEGVEIVFTLAGDHTAGIYYGLQEEGIKVIDFRHESAAVSAGMGYSRSSGKPAVVVVTAGPGEANAFGALMDAVQGCTPVLVISGGSPVVAYQTGAMQEYDFIPHYRSVCNWSERVYATDRIADYVHIAFRNMLTGTSGPALLEIPYDVLNDLAPATTAEAHQGSRLMNLEILAGEDAVNQAAELLANAERPVMVVGNQVTHYRRNREYAGKLSEYLRMPIGTIFEGKGWAADEALHPELSMGLLGTVFADVILLVEQIPDYMVMSLNAPAYNPEAKFISINTDPAMIGFNRDVAVGLVGTPGDVCKQIYEKVTALRAPQTDNSFVEMLVEFGQSMDEADIENVTSDASPINRKRATAEIINLINTDREWAIVADGGDAPSGLSMPLLMPETGRFTFESRFGSIGTGLPMAIGHHYATGRKTMLVSGDGSFGFYLAELTTAISRNLPLVCVILNDSCWGMIKGMEFGIHEEVLVEHEKKDRYGIALNLPTIAFDKVCEAMGGYGETVTDPAQIVPAIKRGEATGKVAVINVICEDITVPGNTNAGTTMYSEEFKAMVKF